MDHNGFLERSVFGGDIVVPAIDHSMLPDHENGAVAATQAISCSRDPLAYVDFLKGLFGANEVHVSDQRLVTQLGPRSGPFFVFDQRC